MMNLKMKMNQKRRRFQKPSVGAPAFFITKPERGRETQDGFSCVRPGKKAGAGGEGRLLLLTAISHGHRTTYIMSKAGTVEREEAAHWGSLPTTILMARNPAAALASHPQN